MYVDLNDRLFLYFPYFTPVLYNISFSSPDSGSEFSDSVWCRQSIAWPSANLPVNQTLTLEVGKVVLETLLVHQKHQNSACCPFK